jgi:hypothetical protein
MTHYTLKHSRVVDWNTPALRVAREAQAAANAVAQQAELFQRQWQKALTTRIEYYQRIRARDEGYE